VVEPWFKPLAYAFILSRRVGYPFLFLPGCEGAQYRDCDRDGKPHASSTDITKLRSEVIRTNELGWAEIRCPAGPLSAWVETPTETRRSVAAYAAAECFRQCRPAA
jgi:hypothetical protein